MWPHFQRHVAMNHSVCAAPTKLATNERKMIVNESEPNCGRSIHAARRALGEFAAAEVLVNTASFLTENSSLRTATLTCARKCAPSSVHRICCFFAMRWLTTWLTADSAVLLLIGSPLR